ETVLEVGDFLAFEAEGIGLGDDDVRRGGVVAAGIDDLEADDALVGDDRPRGRLLAWRGDDDFGRGDVTRAAVGDGDAGDNAVRIGRDRGGGIRGRSAVD